MKASHKYINNKTTSISMESPEVILITSEKNISTSQATEFILLLVFISPFQLRGFFLKKIILLC